MRGKAGYFSFILAFFLCTAMLFAYAAVSRASAGPDSRSFLEEKRFYAVSDMEFSMYQVAGQALLDAKKNLTQAKEALDAAGIVMPEAKAFTGTASQFVSQHGREIARAYVLMQLELNAARLKSVYPDYGVVFWCGPVLSLGKGAALGAMLKAGKALPPDNSILPNPQLDAVACSNYMGVVEDRQNGSWSLDFSDSTGSVPAITQFSKTGIGMSVYDSALNQSSIHVITRLYGVSAP